MSPSQDKQNQAPDPNLARQPSVKVLINKIQDLPTLPAVAVQALEAAMQEEVNIAQLAGIIEADPALSLKLLKLVNSPQHALSKKISTVHQAASLLGLTTLRCCLLGVVTQDYLAPRNQELLAEQKKLWSHSLACAVAAQLIAQKTYPELKQEAFMAGILHDIGKAVLMLAFPETYTRLQSTQQTVQARELAELGCTHSQAGKWLASKWLLPEKLLQAIHYHHHSPAALQNTHLQQELLWILILADQLAHEYFLDQNPLSNDQARFKYLLNLLNLQEKDIEQIQFQIATLYSKRAHLFNLENDPEQILVPVIQRARHELAAISLDLEHKRQSLEYSNQLLELTKDMALDLGQACAAEEVFYAVASSFLHWEKYHAGVVYTVDMENRILEGQVWLQSQQSKRFICFLDNKGHPVWDHQTQDLPQGLKKIISSYRDRMQTQQSASIATGSGCLQYQAPFYILPLTSDKSQIYGELSLAPNHREQQLHAEDRAALQQIASLILAALETIKSQENVEVRNEELSLALWKNQQINHELMQTERLAAVGQLAAGAAHEINNPLAIINARAQLLQINEEDPKKQGQLKQITDQIERISSILTNLMDFARPAPPQVQDVFLPDILDKVSQLLEPALKRSSIDLSKDYAQDLPRIKADPNQLEQIIMNLLINAQQAMEEKGGTLSLHLGTDQTSQYVLIQIKDQGVGIPDRDLKRIFDPFFSTKDPGKGTGLGLSTSLSIVENHYGKLDLQSTPGAGTTVTIQLPVNLENLRPQAEQYQLQSSKQDRQLDKPRILIVDDEKHIQDLLSEALSAENMEAVCADNGQQALEKLQADWFDLMLLDMRMPVLDGLSLIKAVREKQMDLPILVITGLASHEEIQEALGKGVSKCIKKPFHIKSLLKDIYDVLARK